MFEGGTYEASRVRTPAGLAYEMAADGEPALSWELHPYHLGDDVHVEGPDGEPILRITTDDVVEYVDADFAVIDERDDSVVGLLRWNLRSLLRRQWGLVDPHGIEVATIGASSRLRSTVRRRWLRFVPYRYAICDAEGERLGEQRGSMRPGRAFVLELDAGAADATTGAGGGEDGVDPRLVVGACAIVDAAEFW